MAHPWLAAGGALPPLHQEQGPGNGHAAADGAAEEAQEEELEEQKQQLLAASLQGLVDSGLQVQHFAAGEALMTRGQQGKLFPVEGVALLACCACVPACLTACLPARPPARPPARLPALPAWLLCCTKQPSICCHQSLLLIWI